MTCSPINLFAGFLTSFHALLGVLLCEFLAFTLCHLPAAVFYHAEQTFSPPNACTGIMYSLCMIFYYSFALCDSIVLLSSVVLSESLAVMALLVGALTGGILWGQYWHQQVRRMCHGVRIVFRRKASGNPPRHFLFWNQQREEAMEQHNMLAEVVSVPVQDRSYHSPEENSTGISTVGAYSVTLDSSPLKS